MASPAPAQPISALRLPAAIIQEGGYNVELIGSAARNASSAPGTPHEPPGPLRARPTGIPQAEHFEIVDTPLPPLAEGHFRVRIAFLSVDPAMRGWARRWRTTRTPVAIGEVMRSFAVAEVIESRHPLYAAGDALVGMFGWQACADSDGTESSGACASATCRSRRSSACWG